MDLLFVLGRILFGGFFVISGIRHFQHLPMMASFTGQKGMPAPKLAVIVSGLLILLGGLSILLGVRPTWGIHRCDPLPGSGHAHHAQLLGRYRSVREADESGELSEERRSAGRSVDAQHGAAAMADEPGSLTRDLNDRESPVWRTPTAARDSQPGLRPPVVAWHQSPWFDPWSVAEAGRVATEAVIAITSGSWSSMRRIGSTPACDV